MKYICVPEELLETLEFMICDLKNNSLSVTLGEPLEVLNLGAKVRIVDGQNTQWYREFCAAYTTNRTVTRKKSKHDTIIKRRDTTRLLKNMVRRKKTFSGYAEHLLDIARELKRHYEST